MALEITDANFATEVLSSDKPALVDFSAAWCGPCKALGPIIDELATEYDGRVTIGKVDIDSSPDTAAKFGIMSVPTLLFFKGGEKIDSMVGLGSKDAIKNKIDEML